MLVLFQTFLMMARSSSLACSKLPGQQTGRVSALDRATSRSADGGWLSPVAAAALGTDFAGGGGDDCCAPGQPSLRSHLPQALASSTQSGRLQRLSPPVLPAVPGQSSIPCTLGLFRLLQAALQVLGLGPSLTPAPLSLPSRGSLPCRCHPHPPTPAVLRSDAPGAHASRPTPVRAGHVRTEAGGLCPTEPGGAR